jgi:hypothetical protein
MARLPKPGSDENIWGDLLNEFLSVSLQDDGTLKASAVADKEPVIAPGTTNQFWRGDKSWQPLDKTAVGLGNVDNTSDLAKPVSTATQTQLDAKANAADVIAFAIAL